MQARLFSSLPPSFPVLLHEDVFLGSKLLWISGTLGLGSFSPKSWLLDFMNWLLPDRRVFRAQASFLDVQTVPLNPAFGKKKFSMASIHLHMLMHISVESKPH